MYVSVMYVLYIIKVVVFSLHKDDNQMIKASMSWVILSFETWYWKDTLKQKPV